MRGGIVWCGCCICEEHKVSGAVLNFRQHHCTSLHYICKYSLLKDSNIDRELPLWFCSGFYFFKADSFSDSQNCVLTQILNETEDLGEFKENKNCMPGARPVVCICTLQLVTESLISLMGKIGTVFLGKVTQDTMYFTPVQKV